MMKPPGGPAAFVYLVAMVRDWCPASEVRDTSRRPPARTSEAKRH